MKVRPLAVEAREDMTVQRVLEEPLFRRATVLLPSEATSKVAWAHSWHDVAGGARDLSGTVVVLTRDELTVDVVRDLAERDVPALFVLGGVETPTLDALRSRPAQGPAVVVMPETAALRDITELVARLALAHETHVLMYAQRVHGELARLLHRGAGLDALGVRMSRLTSCAVMVLSQDMQMLAFDNGPLPWLNPTTAGPMARRARDFLESHFADSTMEAEPLIAEVDLEDRTVTVVVAPIAVAGRREGWIILLSDATPHDHDLAERRVVVEQASTIVGTEILRARDIERAEERAKGNFAHALLHRRFTNHPDLVARAQYHHFDVDHGYAVVIARSPGLIADADAPTRLASMALEARHLSPVPDRETLAVVIGDTLCVVRPLAAQDPGHRGAESSVREYAVLLERRLNRSGRRPVSVTYGRAVQGALNVRDSYREARITMELRDRLEIPDVQGYEDLRVDSVLLDLAQSEEGRAFAHDLLAPLREERHADLAELVATYLKSGANINETARRVNAHRNTLLYKLDRVSKLLKLDIRDPDTQFTVWLALRLDALHASASAVDRELASG